ncbi:MAG: cation:proton antiporter [Armatimonadetes bacterium]|nr:MAG: cation:proton antiporter [Armatimonadota bacterium]
MLLVEIGAVVLGLGILARLSDRIGVSPIPLYLLVGLAFGDGGLIPMVTSEEFIEVGAEIGVILLLLMLGLEYSARELVTGMRPIAPAGLVDLVLNFTPGFVVGMLLGWGPAASVFLGGVTYISSSGVVAKLLNDLGWTGNRETPVVLAILVFEDLAMAFLLPILGAIALGGAISAAVAAVAIAIGVLVVALYVAYRHGDRIGELVFHRSDEVSLLTVFGLALVVAGLAESINISAAVGAFLVGISLSGEAASRAHVLLAPFRDLFAAVFFVFFGLSTDPADIPGVLAIAVLLGLVTAGTKIVTGWYAAKRGGIGRAGRRRAGLALIARGEFSIIIAGLAVGVVGAEELPALAAAYVLILAVAGPVVAKFADPAPTPRPGTLEVSSEDGAIP